MERLPDYPHMSIVDAPLPTEPAKTRDAYDHFHPLSRHRIGDHSATPDEEVYVFDEEPPHTWRAWNTDLSEWHQLMERIDQTREKGFSIERDYKKEKPRRWLHFFRKL